MVWPMMTVTVTNFEGTDFEKFAKMWNSGIFVRNSHYFFQNWCLVKPSKFVTVTVVIGHTHDFLMIFF